VSLPSHCTRSLCLQSFTVSFEGLVTLTHPVPVTFWQPIGSRLPLRCSEEGCPAPVCSADPSLRHLRSPLGCQCIAAIRPGWTARQLCTVLLRVFSVRHCTVSLATASTVLPVQNQIEQAFWQPFSQCQALGGFDLPVQSKVCQCLALALATYAMHWLCSSFKIWEMG